MKHTLTQTFTLTTLAALILTGCSNQPTGSVPEPETSSPTSSTSDTTNPSEAPTDEAPTAQAQESYSGGSKAPDGDYRPADEHGPAQNVPKPVAPEGMNVESAEAMLLFIDYWNDMRNYAHQTGDVATAKALVDESFQQELDFYDALKEIYESGGWIIGGNSTIHYNDSLIISLGNGAYSVGSNINVADSILLYNEEATYSKNSEASSRGVELQLQFSDENWKITGAKKVGE
ncbi:MAG: DUF6318 family protein [Rothia sp. (in: high G+C Gram-positive bacteria)]|nr:DUF6318 family protein [Rothia sp. (in: high G+C Gram-positive bacteria)]